MVFGQGKALLRLFLRLKKSFTLLILPTPSSVSIAELKIEVADSSILGFATKQLIVENEYGT